MEMYLLKSAACLAVLLLFYKLLLERENMHMVKRYYLLSSVLAALLIPLITFTTYVEPSSEKFKALIYTSDISSETTSGKPDLSYIFYGIYLLGVLFFSVKFIRNLRNLLVKIRTNPKVREGSFINVLLSEKVQPHTFFSFIFFNKEKYLQNEIAQDVKIHEQAHARQLHSLDVIFMELLQIIFWFNPLIFLLKGAVKLNHEFLADREVILNGISTSTYQQTLLAYSSKDLQSDLVNPINYSSIKKRFTIMKSKTSNTAFWVRSFLIFPLIVLLVYGFSDKTVVVKDSENVFIGQETSPAPPKMEEYLNDNSRIFLAGKIISTEEAVKLINTRRKELTISILENEENIPSISIEFKKQPEPPKTLSTENQNLFMVAQAPPPPNENPLKYVQELAKRGASFYIGPHKYSQEEVIEMVRKSTNEITIDVSEYPTIRIGGC
ncbi:MAG: M56 family metallopeptidase [Gillisia sp.]